MRLRERGISVTQATLSRDIRELGLVKRTADGAYRSVDALAIGDPGDAEAGLARATAEYLRNQEVVGHMIVLRTDPGQAQTLAVAIDRAHLREIVGTIAGDDTILVVARDDDGGSTAGAALATKSRRICSSRIILGTSRAISIHNSSEYGISRRFRRRSESAGEGTSCNGSALRPPLSQCAIGSGCNLAPRAAPMSLG